METFIQLPEGGSAFITWSDDRTGCEHDWSDEILSRGKDYKRVLRSVFSKWSLKGQKMWLRKAGGMMCSVYCPKCKNAYTDIFNPYMEE